MKWMLYIITGIILFVIVFFGISLISNEQKNMSNETLDSPEYQQQAETNNILLDSFAKVPYVVLIFAAIIVLFFLARKAGML